MSKKKPNPTTITQVQPAQLVTFEQPLTDTEVNQIINAHPQMVVLFYMLREAGKEDYVMAIRQKMCLQVSLPEATVILADNTTWVRELIRQLEAEDKSLAHNHIKADIEFMKSLVLEAVPNRSFTSHEIIRIRREGLPRLATFRQQYAQYDWEDTLPRILKRFVPKYLSEVFDTENYPLIGLLVGPHLWEQYLPEKLFNMGLKAKI